jgi:cysteinyl-tRNA synthetase
MGALTERFIAAMDEDAAALGIEKPDHEPRATQYMQGMLDMIEVLRQKGLAYQATDGDVKYAVRKFESYGKLSGKSLDDLCPTRDWSAIWRKTIRSTLCCGNAPRRAVVGLAVG